MSVFEVVFAEIYANLHSAIRVFPVANSTGRTPRCIASFPSLSVFNDCAFGCLKESEN